MAQDLTKTLQAPRRDVEKPTYSDWPDVESAGRQVGEDKTEWAVQPAPEINNKTLLEIQVTKPTEGGDTELVKSSEPELSKGEETIIETGATIRHAPANDGLPKVGDKLKNRYELVEELGKGGMGSVFKAIDHQAEKHKDVAIKLLLPELAKDDSLVRDFVREVEKARELSNDNIIKVYNYDNDGNRHFMTMEYLQGVPLKVVIANNAPIPLNKAWRLIKGMGKGLAYAHSRPNKIIHRDFKPGNIFVLENIGEVKILDFGIAAELKSVDSGETFFQGNIQYALNTLYASYEMLDAARNGTQRKADPRDDIYAFGLITYELLTGQHPYHGKPADEAYQSLQNTNYKPPEPPPGLSKKQWQLLKQAIEIKENNRPEDLWQWLKEFDPEHIAPVWKKWVIPSSVLVSAAVIGVALWKIQPDEKPVVSPPESIQDTHQTSKVIPTPKAQPPLANAGTDQVARVGHTVTLNGGQSQPFVDGTLNYRWQLLSKPEHSDSRILQDNTATPQLTPDRPGTYQAQLQVTDAEAQTSEPAVVTINASNVNFETQPSYPIGGKFKATITPSETGYLSVFYVNSTGEKFEIFPIVEPTFSIREKNRVVADQKIQRPPPKKGIQFTTKGPEGTDRLIAFFSKEPLPDEAGLKPYIKEDGETMSLPPEITAEQIEFQIIEK